MACTVEVQLPDHGAHSPELSPIPNIWSLPYRPNRSTHTVSTHTPDTLMPLLILLLLPRILPSSSPVSLTILLAWRTPLPASKSAQTSPLGNLEKSGISSSNFPQLLLHRWNIAVITKWEIFVWQICLTHGFVLLRAGMVFSCPLSASDLSHPLCS